jgi:hypothetical protein
MDIWFAEGWKQRTAEHPFDVLLYAIPTSHHHIHLISRWPAPQIMPIRTVNLNFNKISWR